MQFFATWVWAAIPIWLAIQVPLGAGDYVWLPLTVGSGAAAPIALWCASIIRNPIWRLVAVLIGLLTAGWNITTAVGSAASHRQLQAAPNAHRIAERESMLQRQTWLVERIAKIGWRLNGDTPFSVEAKINRLKTTSHYLRTDGCRNLKALDPERVCSSLAEEEGRLNEARQVEGYEAERERLRLDLLKVDGPASADVQSETIQRLLANFIAIDLATVTALLNGVGPLIMELTGTAMPPLMSRVFHDRNRRRTAEDAEDVRRVSSDPPVTLPHNVENSLITIAEDHPPTLRKPSANEAFGLWIAEHVEDSAEDSLQARPAFLHYSAWGLRNEYETLTERGFSSKMEGRGFCKQKLNRGHMHYMAIRLKSSKLKVVK